MSRESEHCERTGPHRRARPKRQRAALWQQRGSESNHQPSPARKCPQVEDEWMDGWTGGCAWTSFRSLVSVLLDSLSSALSFSLKLLIALSLLLAAFALLLAVSVLHHTRSLSVLISTPPTQPNNRLASSPGPSPCSSSRKWSATRTTRSFTALSSCSIAWVSSRALPCCRPTPCHPRLARDHVYPAHCSPPHHRHIFLPRLCSTPR